MSRDWQASSVDWPDIAKWELWREACQREGVTCEQVQAKIRLTVELVEGLTELVGALLADREEREREVYLEGLRNGRGW